MTSSLVFGVMAIAVLVCLMAQATAHHNSAVADGAGDRLAWCLLFLVEVLLVYQTLGRCQVGCVTKAHLKAAVLSLVTVSLQGAGVHCCTARAKATASQPTQQQLCNHAHNRCASTLLLHVA